MSMDAFQTFFSSPAGANEVTRLVFAVRRLLAKMHTTLPVQVISCTNDGAVAIVGTVDVMVLVNQIDGAGNTVSPGAVIHGVPYCRVQGGTNAVICDPVAGDIGVCCFAEKDLSIVLASKGAGNPGSNRRNSLADAIYVGAFPNAVPTQYARFSTDGVDVVSPTAVTATVGSTSMIVNTSQISLAAGGSRLVINASGSAFTGPVTGDQTATFTGEVEGNGIKLSVLRVSGVTAGSDPSGPPVPGT